MGPLFEAILSGRNLCPILEAGYSPNVYSQVEGVGWTPLHLAVYRGLPEVAEILLEAGANPNSPTLPVDSSGPFHGWIGLTPLDIAISLDEDRLVSLLIQHGGRPTLPHRFPPKLRYELDQARAVDVAESLVVEPVLLPLAEKAQRAGDWDEADRLFRRIMICEGEGERTRHLRIRGLLVRGKVDEAMEEASLIFVGYRQQGNYSQALQVVRAMRRVDPTSCRPYELEIEYLSSLGFHGEAEACQKQLLQLHLEQGREAEIPASRARFEILRRRPENRGMSRPPTAWMAPGPSAPGLSSNLPALLEEEDPIKPPGWKLWWDSSA